MNPARTIRDVPTGEVLWRLATLSEPGIIARVGIAHDEGCPCIEWRAGFSSCTCATVHLTIEQLDREQGEAA